MAVSLQLNARNDLFLNNDKNLGVVRGVTAVEQDCKNAMQAQLGEMILAINRGMPTLNTVWDILNINQFNSYGRATLLSVPGVTEVTSFTSQAIGNVLNYTATIKTIYGNGTVNG